jgi:small subunit ribosomal protein S1
MGKEQPFAILKMDRPRGNIVVSRRAILEEARAEQRTELVGQLLEGEIREGVVKNITDYGAFVDLGGIDGLLHVTDMSWKRVSHPSQVLAVGDSVKVQIVKINPDTQRISLGMKQLQADPWDGVEAKYPVGAKYTGRITNITDYGAFVELEAGVEGLVHVSEMSWTKKNVHPGKIVSTSQEVDVVVLDVDSAKRRISLGLKQAQANPWDAFLGAHPIGSTVEGEVKNATEFGLFIGLDSDIDGMVHLSDLDWSVSGEEAIQRYRKGDMVKAKVLDVDVEKERISLGIKQLGGDPIGEGDTYRKGQQVTVTVSAVESGGIEVRFGEDDAPVSSFIRKSDLSRDRNEQRPERFAVGDRIDAMVTNVDKASRRISVSVKALEMKDEQEAIEQFGSSDSGASLGDILGAALRERSGKE